MEEHSELLKKEVDRAFKILNREERIDVNLNFLGILQAALKFSKDGKLTASDIVDAYKDGIRYVLNEREQDNSVTCDDCEGTGESENGYTCSKCNGEGSY